MRNFVWDFHKIDFNPTYIHIIKGEYFSLQDGYIVHKIFVIKYIYLCYVVYVKAVECS